MARTFEELLKNEKPEVVAEAQDKASDILLNIHLAEIRKRSEKTQIEIADKVGVKQPTIAGMEKPGQDLKLSTLKRYIEATGGKLRLDVELPDGSHYGFHI